uniref:ABC transmembrane type-1 domain-containing protein n=1 Tax=Heterorhabditis bacteriophora TaxID=37862 RepID=A0A1I7WSN9_HETBA
MFLCIENYQCKASSIGKHIVAMVFTFIQMHFIFCNSKVSSSMEISITGSHKLAKLGMMHLVSLNLWTWFRFVLAKTAAKVAKKSKSYEIAKDSSSSSSSSEEEGDYKMDHGFLTEVVNATVEAIISSTPTITPPLSTTMKSSKMLVTLQHFGDVATFLTTCIVEYSLIGAAVMFILWKSIGHAHHSDHSDLQVKRKYRMRIDCRMRLLQYRLHAHGEVIDEILLIIGLVGELIYCVIGLDIFIATRRAMTDRSLLPAFVFVCRLTQVVVQSAFILTTSRLVIY